MRNDHEFPQFQPGGDHDFAESGQVVLVGVTDLFEESVNTEAFKQP